MPTFDAIVLGLGGMGSAAAMHLAGTGRRVLGIDQFSAPHDRGSSHGHTRVIRQAYFEHPSYVPLLLRAYELWRELEQSTGRRLLDLCGGLMMGEPDSDVVRGSLQSARTHGLAHDLLEAGDIRRRFPPFRISDRTVALLEPNAGLVYCEAAISAHLDVAARRGADLRFHQPVMHWKSGDNGGVSVTSSQRTYHAEHLVITPGPWAPALLPDLGLPLVVERQVLYWFQPPEGTTRYLPDRHPVHIWQRADGTTPYGFPAVDGPSGGVKAAFYRQETCEVCTPESVDRSIRDAEIERMRAALREYLPGLAGPLVRATTCLYTMTPDHHFVIGSHPRHANVHLAAGFSGHGFKFCSVVGERLAQHVTGTAQADSWHLFSPDRFRHTPEPGADTKPGQSDGAPSRPDPYD